LLDQIKNQNIPPELIGVAGVAAEITVLCGILASAEFVSAN